MASSPPFSPRPNRWRIFVVGLLLLFRSAKPTLVSFVCSFGSTDITFLSVVVVGLWWVPFSSDGPSYLAFSQPFVGRHRFQGPQGSCGGAASSLLGGWWRHCVLPDSGCPPPRRQDGVVSFNLIDVCFVFICSSLWPFVVVYPCLWLGLLARKRRFCLLLLFM
jgi:hypothetical protein